MKTQSRDEGAHLHRGLAFKLGHFGECREYFTASLMDKLLETSTGADKQATS